MVSVLFDLFFSSSDNSCSTAAVAVASVNGDGGFVLVVFWCSGFVVLLLRLSEVGGGLV